MDGRILYNPLAVLGKGKGFAAAMIVVIVLAIVAWWGGVHLDGALDMHVIPKPPSGLLIFGESLIAWLSLGLFLFAGAKIFGGNSGLGAHLAAAGLGRFPYILAAIVFSRPVLGRTMLKAVSLRGEEIVVRPQDLLTPGLIIGGFAVLAFVIWAIVILYLGYREASRLRGGKAVASFVIGIILAEAISKLLLWLVI